MSLKKKIQVNNSAYDTVGVRQLFYDHLAIIRDKADEVVVTGVAGLKYRVNLYGLYYHLGIAQPLWNLTTLINKFDHTTKIEDLTTVLAPNRAQIEKLVRTHNTKESGSAF